MVQYAKKPYFKKNNKIGLYTTNTPKVIRTIKNCVNACTINKCDQNTKCMRYLHISEF